jgi:tetratricopeptide (TPR) repeat protein
MNRDEHATWGALPWTAGWCFSAANPRDEATRHANCILRTLGTPGDLAPLGAPVRWSFHLGITARASVSQVQLRADGFRIHFTWGSTDCTAFAALVEPGILIGCTNAPLKPSLFSAEYEIHHAGDMEWMDLDETRVVLLPECDKGITRFCLAVGSWDHTQAMEHARRCLDLDVEQILARGDILRQDIAEKLTEIPPDLQELVVYATESLLARIQPAEGAFPLPWCSTSNTDDASLNVNLLFHLIAAWSRIDPHMAENTLRTLFSFQRPDGALPVTLRADGSADFARAPHPLVAQAVRCLQGHTTFIRYALPHLRNYIAWAMHRFDPTGAGLPRWRNAHEAWIGQTFDPQITSADLAAMLLCEIEAYDAMAREVSLSSAGEFRAAAGTLARNLEHRYWNPSAGAFFDTFENSAHVERITLGTAPALLWSGIGNDERKAVLKLLDRSDALATSRGTGLWMRWEGDPHAPPVRAEDQILVLECLARSKATSLERKYRSVIWKTLSSDYAGRKRIFDDFSAARAEETPSAYALADAAAAMLTIVLSGPLSNEEEEEEVTQGFSSWFARHAKTVITTAVAVPVAAALITVVSYMAKSSPPLSSLEASLGMAMQYYREGHYDKAIALYEDLTRKGGGFLKLEVQMGNAYFRRGDLQRAEFLYRAALKQPAPPPAAFLNLGLALFRQGRHSEALAFYNQYLDLFGDRWPDQAEKARTAIHLIQQQSPSSNSPFARGS